LTPPSPEGLLGLMDIINTQHDYFSSYYDGEDNPEFDFRLSELSNGLAVVDAETKLHYAAGFPNPEIIWDYYPFFSSSPQPLLPAAYLDALTTAILEGLNQRPGDLKDQATREENGRIVNIYQVEIDYDPGPEWLVRMHWKEIAALSWLVLDQNADGTYTRLRRSLPDIPWISPISQVTIEALQDFTGDGLTDVIFLDSGYSAGSYSYKFQIAKGTENGFEALRSISAGVPVILLGNSAYYEIGIPAGSTWLHLTVSDPQDLNWGCAWTTKTSYRWSYGREQIFISDKEMPKTPECSLAQAVSVLEPVNDTTAIRLLENAIHHFDQKDVDQHGKLLFAHYRLALLYTGLNQSLSRQHLEWIIENSTEAEGNLPEKLSSLLEEEKINPIRLCDMLYRGSEVELPNHWKKYFSETAAIQAFPASTEIYLPAICPLQDIVMDQLREVNLNTQPIPESALTDQGIPVSAIQTYPFPNQKYPASFVLLGETTLYVVGYLPTSLGWQWRLIGEFDPSNGLPQTFFEDVTGDDFPELAYFQAYHHRDCSGDEQGFQVLLTTYSGSGFVSLTQHVCHPVNEAFDVTRYLADEDGDGVVDWVAEQIRDAGSDSSPSAQRVKPGTWFALDEVRPVIPEQNSSGNTPADLISRLYVGDQSAIIRRRLIREREELDLAEAWADREWQRLTYLIAVSYEIEGQTDQALETFISVLQSENQTLWGNLAALHLMAR
jgi:hypothetical protein